jgi:penicillin G amidase
MPPYNLRDKDNRFAGRPNVAGIRPGLVRGFLGLLTLFSLGNSLAAPVNSTAVHRESWKTRGLEQPAEIVIDHWGIPHIFAKSRRDAFFLQGFNAARDRLWQIDLWRKRGLGLLSASFGPAFVEQDRAARLLLYRGDMTREWVSYAPGAHEAAEAFAEGVNAYVAEVRAGTKPLPLEFRLTHSAPDTWNADDIVRIRSHALVSNVVSEVTRAHVACLSGVDADQLRHRLEPAHKTRVPDGLNPCDIPDEVLKDYRLGTGPVRFVAPGQKRAADTTATRWASLDQHALEGSNNWVISPSHSASGHAVLGNDPHRTLGIPALRYIVELNAPDLQLIGAGEPALPGISLGHNAHAAFGITIFNIDQEDLYVYALKPGDPDRYRYRNGWESMRAVHESIPVKGEKARDVVLRFTRHGPVLFVDAKANRAFALRSVWSEPGASGYFGSSRLWDAKSWKDFLVARDAWGTPPLNLVYADRAGNIGWSPGGLTPIRPNWDGLLPVPGDGRFEWQGFLAGRDLPSVENPSSGWFATANEMNLPEGYLAEQRKISFEWSDRSRIDRIKSVLSSKASLGLSDSMALQTDSHSAESARLIALLANLSSPDRLTDFALTRLKTWDGDETVESVAAAIYEVWVTKHLPQLTAAKLAPKAAKYIAEVPGASLDAIITYLEHPDTRLGVDPRAARDALLLASLADATKEIEHLLGSDPNQWSWGRLHHASFAPAVAVLADPQLRAQMSVGPLEVPGSASTPRAATYRTSDFAAISGASIRLVLDTGNWDNSVAINTPGESGDPFSPHYRDLFPLWAAGDYVPLLFSRAAVEREAETIIVLMPETAPR